MLTEEGVKKAVSRIALMPFFPSSDPNARALVFEDIVNICESDAHAEWLAMRFCQVFRNGWPGLEELRAVYCARFKPCDKRFADSHAYPDGIPSEREMGIIEVKGLPALCAPLPALDKGVEQVMMAGSSRKFLAQLMAPEEQQEFEKVQESIARRDGTLPAAPAEAAPDKPKPTTPEHPPARQRSAEELARIDRLKIEIDQLREVELERRASAGERNANNLDQRRA
jgi:hypothetical protein